MVRSWFPQCRWACCHWFWRCQKSHPWRFSVIGGCWLSGPAPISSCLIIVDIGELWSKLGASIQWTIKINNNHKTTPVLKNLPQWLPGRTSVIWGSTWRGELCTLIGNRTFLAISVGLSRHGTTTVILPCPKCNPNQGWDVVGRSLIVPLPMGPFTKAGFKPFYKVPGILSSSLKRPIKRGGKSREYLYIFFEHISETKHDPTQRDLFWFTFPITLSPLLLLYAQTI